MRTIVDKELSPGQAARRAPLHGARKSLFRTAEAGLARPSRASSALTCAKALPRALLVCVGLVLATAPALETLAGTLGRVTAVQRNPNAVVIDGQRFLVVAESQLYEAIPGSSDPAVVSFGAVSEGDLVVYENDGAVIKSIQRVPAADIDAPPAAPLPVRPGQGG
jgi:hypothetical protein